MVDLIGPSLRLLGALFLVVLNGFFVASEFAFVRIRSTTVEQLAAEGRAGSATLQGVMENLDDYLATTQLGITIASLGLGWIGEPAVAALIEPVAGAILPDSVVHLVAFAIGFSFITFLHVVFGELAPKTLAIADAEKISLFVAPPMKLCYYLLYPGIVVFNGAANAFTRAIGVPPVSETEETLQEEEIMMVLSRSGRQGHVDKAEVEMIERVFELDDTTAREVMVPRPDVVSVEADLSLAALRSLVVDSGHTRYPVVEGDDGDQVVGFVDVKDILRADESGSTDGTAGELARDLPVVPETAPLDDLLATFRDDQVQMAAVIDEWGALEGLVTVEDAVEAVVGDLRDGFDAERGEPSIERRDDGSYVADGALSLVAVNDEVGATLEDDDYDTVGGLVLGRLGRAPETGDRVEADGYVLAVEAVEGTRIETVGIRGPGGADPAE